KAEDYTHRIGRTGRAGRDGLAITFAEMRDRRKIFDIEAFTRQRIAVDTVAGMEPRQRAPMNEPMGRGAPGRNYANPRGNDRFGDRRGAPARGPRFEGGRNDAPRFEGRGDAPRFEGNRGDAGRFGNRGGPRSVNRFDHRGSDNRPAPAGRGGFPDRGPARSFGKPTGFSNSGRHDNASAPRSTGDRFSDRGHAERSALRGGEFAPRRNEGGGDRPMARRQPR